jgi:hypothetical protein
LYKAPNINKPEDIVNIETKDINVKLLRWLFAHRKEGPRFTRTDSFILKKGQYPGLDKDTKTTIGNYIINRALFNENAIKIVGYVNKRFNSKVVEDIESKLANALLNDKIDVKDLIYYMDRIQFFGFAPNDIFSPSLTEKTIFLPDSIRKEKEKLVQANKDNIDDPLVAVSIRDQLIKKAKDSIGKDPGLDLYESGSKASFENNFAKLFLMNGSIMDLESGQLKTSTHSYSEGVPKSEMQLFANSMVTSSYASGVATQQGGFKPKNSVLNRAHIKFF